MADPIRIPLVETLEPRLADSTKDSLASNVFYDKGQNGSVYATKRPGLTSYISATGTASGIFGWNNEEFRIWLERRLWGAAVWTGSYFIVADRSNSGIWEVARIGKSYDGLNWFWTILNSSTAYPTAIAWDGDYLMMPQTTSNVYISQDGESWTSVASPIAFEYITTGNSRFFGTNGSSTYVSSDNGTSWTLCVPNTGTLDNSRIVYNSGNTTYVGIILNSAFAYTSSDGVNFTRNTVAGGISLQAISTNGTTICVLTTTGDIYYSTTGTSWTLVSNTALSATWTSLVWTGAMFVASNQSQGAGQILTSSNGSTWTKTSYSDPFNQFGDETYIVQLAGNSTITVATCFPSIDGNYLYFTSSNSEINVSNFAPPNSLDGYIQRYLGGVFLSETELG